jgi:electron transport complex protein RnfB
LSRPAAGVAVIDARECIGCARCLPVCPVDSIIGAARYLHTVLEAACMGCELCIAACPVDCIRMQPRTSGERAPTPRQNRERHEAHAARLSREARDRAALLDERKRRAHSSAAPSTRPR